MTCKFVKRSIFLLHGPPSSGDHFPPPLPSQYLRNKKSDFPGKKKKKQTNTQNTCQSGIWLDLKKQALEKSGSQVSTDYLDLTGFEGLRLRPLPQARRSVELTDL